MSYGPSVWIFYTYIYVGAVHYGPLLVRKCSSWRNSSKLSPYAKLAMVVAWLGLSYIDPTQRVPYVAWLAIVVEPARLVGLVILTPDLRITGFMGQYLMGTFLTELACKKILLFQPGVFVFGFRVLPPAVETGKTLVKFVRHIPFLQVVLAYMTTLAYSLLVCCLIGPFFQLFLVRTLTGTTHEVKAMFSKIMSLRSVARAEIE